MLYAVLKLIHLLGVILLLGNVTVTAVWKVFADRTRNPVVIAFGQRLVTLTDWSITLLGIVLTMGGGFGMTFVLRINPFGQLWLVVGQVLFVVAGAIWVGILIPAQIRQAREAHRFADGGEVPESYRRDARRWIIWGVISTLPLVGAIWVMIVKPV